jgi:hypothetical protein
MVVVLNSLDKNKYAPITYLVFQIECTMLQSFLKLVVICFLLFADNLSPADSEIHTHKAHFIVGIEGEPLFKNTLDVATEPHKMGSSADHLDWFSGLNRPYQPQAIRFTHPKQQADFILVFELLLDTFIAKHRLSAYKRLQPWYEHNSRPTCGFIDACKPANLLYKARLTYHI